jgi:hypothetical protein
MYLYLYLYVLRRLQTAQSQSQSQPLASFNQTNLLHLVERRQGLPQDLGSFLGIASQALEQGFGLALPLLGTWSGTQVFLGHHGWLVGWLVGYFAGWCVFKQVKKGVQYIMMSKEWLAALLKPCMHMHAMVARRGKDLKHDDTHTTHKTSLKSSESFMTD